MQLTFNKHKIKPNRYSNIKLATSRYITHWSKF